ncbi:hypothetical protein N7539_006028 [Penicillium diatomitis]|uniref:Uncharacterized protein n=1 Tax=Penicillium diatomitis TaxID=2819901 RepID=A0A9W9X4P6_9EURO|nr:uncharacterized protein N7539_006028 [Penicillium diatomitis]KAJ5483828.1 hypothetical protein N7539_006028 [Penicillium diatomitis]
MSVTNWALLGYLVIPGTFTTLQHSSQMEKELNANDTGREILRTIQNPPLLIIARILFGTGVVALVWLLCQRKLRIGYIWLFNRIFMPMSLSAAAGLLTTYINVCTSKGQD